MVKKIINWTANGFFRSLGRFLFFFCITAILALLFANSSLKITDLLGIDTVYAATQNYNSAYMSVKTCAPNTPSYSCNWYGNWNVNTGYHQPNSTSFQGYLNEWDLHVVGNNSNTFTSDRTYNIVMGIGVSSSNVGTGSSQHSLYYYLRQLIKPQFKMVGGPNAGESGATTSYIKSFACSMTENENAINRVYINCTFTPSATLKYFRVAILYGDNTDLYFDNYGWMTFDEFTYSTDASGAINQQTTIIQNEFNNTNQLIEDITGTLQDDDVDDDTNDMIDFFNDFELEGSGDIDTLLTIPITFIENVFTTNSTVDLCVSFRSKNICLPNGKILWNRTYQCNEQVMLCDSNNGSIAGLLNLFSTLFGGYLAYKIMRSIFHTYNDILDPTKDKVEVMDL